MMSSKRARDWGRVYRWKARTDELGRYHGPLIEDPIEAVAWLLWDRSGQRRGPPAEFEIFVCNGCEKPVERQDGVLTMYWRDNRPFGHAACVVADELDDAGGETGEQ